MDITLLAHVEHEGSEDCDPCIGKVADTLRISGHRPSILCVHDDIVRLVTELRRRKPDLIFNLLEQFGQRQLGLVEATGLIDLLDIPYTGGGAGELYLQEDKALTKKLLAYENLQCPDFAVFSPQSDLETGGNLRMPLLVKPLRMEASQGIDAARSLVHTTAEMMEQIARIHRELGDSALCEQFIDGREFYVGLLGNVTPQVFPPIEMDFTHMPDGVAHVMDAKAKFDQATPEFQGTKPVVASLSDPLRAKLQRVATEAYRALRVRDYGRVDLRMTGEGDIYVIEVNANCYLDPDGEYAMAAAAAGLEYPALISRIAEVALERCAKRAKDGGGVR